MFLGVFRFTENMKFVLKGWIRFYFSGLSLVELRGDDDSATSTVVVIRMSLDSQRVFVAITYTE